MELADFIGLGNQAPPLRFLIIGGWAVAAHGHTRFTQDVDFLVSKVDRVAWLKRAAAAGLTEFAVRDQFAQFSQEDGDGFDLMFVAAESFEKMWDQRVDMGFGETTASVVCLDHLLALKLHALKHTQPHRTSKDMDDVEWLARRNDLDLESERYRELFLKYGTDEIYGAIRRILRAS